MNIRETPDASTSQPLERPGAFFLSVPMLFLLVLLLASLSLPLAAQTCPWTSTLRQESCPVGASCSTKGSTLTYQELDRDLLNIVGLCSGPGLYTWPATGTAGAFRTTTLGAISVVSASGVGSCSAGNYVSALSDNASPTCTADDDTPDSDSEVPDAITINGGTITSSMFTGTSTITGTFNLDSGTEGTLRLPSSTSTPATCTIGDTYWDTDADTDGSLYVCRATNTWKEVDDDGGAGGGAPTTSTYLTLSLDGTLSNERVLTSGTGITLTDGGANGNLTLSFTSADTLVSNPLLASEDTVFTKDGTGGGLLFEGSTADTVEGILIWDPNTSDKTITLPNVTGTVVTTGDTSTVTGTMIINDTIALTTDTSGNYAAGDAEAGNATGLACTTCVDASDIASDVITEPKLKAVDTPADEECLTYESTVGDFEWQTCGSGGGSPGGTDTQVQFNDGGIFGGDSGFIYSKTTDTATLSGSVLVGDGSKTAPGLAFKNDTDSGIYERSVNRLTVSVGGIAEYEFQGSNFALSSDNGLCWTSGGSVDAAGCGTALSDSGSGLISFDNGAIGNGSGSAKLSKLINKVQNLTVADNGNGATRATSTLTPTSSYVSLVCNDANGCDVTLSETGAVDGQILRITNTSGNPCGFADTSGVSELTGAIDVGSYDMLELLYVGDRWVQVGFSNN